MSRPAKMRLTTSEALDLVTREFRICVTISTFRRWCAEWKKTKPKMVIQPTNKGDYYIDEKLLREHFDGYSTEEPEVQAYNSKDRRSNRPEGPDESQYQEAQAD